MIRDFLVNLTQDAFIKKTALEFDFKDLNLIDRSASSKVCCSGSNLVSPVDNLNLLHKALLDSRSDIQVLVELFFRYSCVKVSCLWQTEDLPLTPFQAANFIL